MHLSFPSKVDDVSLLLILECILLADKDSHNEFLSFQLKAKS